MLINAGHELPGAFAMFLSNIARREEDLLFAWPDSADWLVSEIGFG